MKLVIVKGTYHKDGYISSLVEEISKGFKSQNESNEVKIIDLLDAHIEFCGGCKNCGKKSTVGIIGDCPKKDDMHGILEELLATDRVVLASPIYYFTMTALMKRFVERTIALADYENSWPTQRAKINKEKNGAVIVSSDCPTPINQIIGITRSAISISKLVLKLFGCGKIISVATSASQAQSGKTKAYKLGQQLGR